MAFLCATVWVVLALTLVQRQASAQQKCPGLSADYTFCNPLDNCTGLVCTWSFTDSATVSVNKCTDPLKIDVSLKRATGVSFYTFTSSGSVTNAGATVSFLTSRNASYARVEAFRNEDVIIPYAEIPLDQHLCMCESLESITDNTDSHIATDCLTNTACTAVECTLTISPLGNYRLETDVEACQNIPGAFLVLIDPTDIAVFADYFNASRTSMFSISPMLSFPLSVTITHQDYSMLLQVSITIEGMKYNFLPKQQIILGKSDCATIIPIAPPTLPMGQAITMDTCDALNQITISPVLGSYGVSCQTTLDCDALICDVAGFQFYTQLLLCNQPPTVFIQVSESNGVIFQAVLNDSSTFFNLENVCIIQFLVMQTASVITIQVVLYPAFGTTSIDLIQKHEIPFDSCLCPDVICQTPTDCIPTSSTLEPSSNSSSGLSVDSIIAITVPITAVLIIVFLACMVTTVVTIVRKRRKHADSYTFQPMTFVGALDIDDEEDDEDDAGRVIYRERDKEITQEDY